MSEARFDLEAALGAWRRRYEVEHTFSDDDREELERHVRDHVAALVAQGKSEEAAFHEAVRKLGDYDASARAYRAVFWTKAAAKGTLIDELWWRLAMLKNYLKVAWRNVRRQKGYAVLNVGGLAVGMTCCVLILLYVQHEWSYDRFHEHADRMYRLVTDVEEDGQIQHYAYVPLPVVTALQDVPDIQKMATIGSAQRRRVQLDETPFYEEGIASASASVFELFSFPLREGNSKTALADPFSVVLTEGLAKKLFSEANPMGRVIRIEDHDYTVTGVLAPIPAASHWRFGALTSQATQRAILGPFYERIRSSWTSFDHTYLLLPEQAAPEALEAKLTALADRLRDSEGAATYTLHLQPITDIHLNSNRRGELSPPGDVRSLYVFSTLALLILLVACINFMNLATARSARRAREVGVRKVVGAMRSQLIGQFLGEALMVSGIALVFAMLLIALLLPVFNEVVGVDLVLDFWGNQTALFGLIGTALLTGLVAGSYPALVLSRFAPVDSLRDRLGASRHGTLRKTLVVVQFVVTTVFVVGTSVVYSQLDYVRNKDLGFNGEHILTLSFRASDQYETFKQELLAYAGIERVTASMGTPGVWAPENVFDPDQATDRDAVAYHWIGVDPDFVETYEIEIVEGRDLDANLSSDATDAFLLNETAVHTLGWDDPIGRTIQLDLNDRKGTVVGVVEDFHHASLHEPIAPLLLYVVDDVFLSTVSVRIRPEDVGGTLAFIEDRWNAFLPDRPFEYSFLDDEFEALYKADARFARLCSYIAFLSILVACLGLLGLSAFAAEQRTKEIGIRKVLGATVSQVIVLLSRDFLKLIVLAFAVAAPVAYFLMHRWLDDFTYRVNITWPVFLIAGLTVLGVALVAVSYQAMRAALADPVQSLRYE